jgi:O-antigen/teichoic acid export membrane protein
MVASKGHNIGRFYEIEILIFSFCMTDVTARYPFNVMTSWLSLAVRMALVFLINPVIIRSLGQERYGVWALIFSLINYLTICDLGMQQGLNRFISRFLSLGDSDKINDIINSSFRVFFMIGSAIMILAAAIAFGALRLFEIPESLLPEAQIVLFIIALNTALNFLMLPYSGTLGAFHRYDLANYIAIAEDLLRSVAILLVLSSGGGITLLAAVYLVFTILRVVISALILKRAVPALRFQPHTKSAETFRSLFNYSRLVFFVSVVWLFIANIDNLILGYFLDLTSVALYAAALIPLVAFRNLINGIAVPLRPTVSHLEALGRTDQIGILYLRGLKYLYFLTFYIAGAAIILAQPFFQLWLGNSFLPSAELLTILIIPTALFLPQSVTESILFATDRPRILLKLLIAEAAVKIALSLLLIGPFGIYGVAYATAVTLTVIYLLVLPFSVNPVFGIDWKVYYLTVLKFALPAFGVSFFLSYFGAMLFPLTGWLDFLLLGLGLLILLALALRIASGKAPHRLFATLFVESEK